MIVKSGTEAGSSSGNLVALEHISVAAPEHRMVATFYIDGLGFAADQRRTDELDQGYGTLWMNAGLSQMQIEEEAARHLPGVIGLIYPDLDTLETRLRSVMADLRHTVFQWKRVLGRAKQDEYIQVIGPYGNQFRAFESSTTSDMKPLRAFDRRGLQPGPRSLPLGIGYIEYGTAPGTARLIARFYQRVLGAHVRIEIDHEAEADEGFSAERAIVQVGPAQELVFTESRQPVGESEHHIGIYVHHFEETFESVQQYKLLYSNPKYNDNAECLEDALAEAQFRFKDIVSLPETMPARPGPWTPILQVEHEIRSIEHPGCQLSNYAKHQLRNVRPSTSCLNEGLVVQF